MLLSLMTTVTEIFGIGIFLPIFQFISLDGDLNALSADSVLWGHIIKGFSFFKIDVSLPNLLLISFSLFLGRQMFTYIRLVYSSAVRQRIIQKQRNLIFNNYIDSGSIRSGSTHQNSIIDFVRNLKDRTGFKVVHTGSNNDKNHDSRVYDFVILPKINTQ